MRCYAAVLFSSLLLCCGGSASPEESSSATDAGGRLAIYVTNYPLQYFAERVGGDRVEVSLPVPAGKDPADWSPDAETVAAYQAADLVLLNGADYEKWVNRVSLPPSKLVDTSADLADRVIYVPNAITHSHGPEGEHSHGETAFTTWLDPTLAIRQADTIRSAFVSARPREESAFQAGFASLERDLVELDGSLQEIFSGNQQPLLASHPVYQYLARRYAIDLRSVHFEPDEYPDQKSWRGLQELLVDHPSRRMLWEGEPLDDTREKLQELGVDIVVYDPCGNRPEIGDFFEVMGRNVDRLRETFTSVTSDVSGA